MTPDIKDETQEISAKIIGAITARSSQASRKPRTEETENSWRVEALGCNPRKLDLPRVI